MAKLFLHSSLSKALSSLWLPLQRTGDHAAHESLATDSR